MGPVQHAAYRKGRHCWLGWPLLLPAGSPWLVLWSAGRADPLPYAPVRTVHAVGDVTETTANYRLAPDNIYSIYF